MCLLMYVLSACFLSSCGSDDNMAPNNDNGSNPIDNLVSFSHSGCKELQQSIPARNDKSPSIAKEGVEFTCLSDGRLFLKHTNAMLCCEQDEIVVESTLSDHVISIVEREVNPKANCVCPYDLDITVGGLESGKYMVAIFIDGIESPSFEFEIDYYGGNSGNFILSKDTGYSGVVTGFSTDNDSVYVLVTGVSNEEEATTDFTNSIIKFDKNDSGKIQLIVGTAINFSIVDSSLNMFMEMPPLGRMNSYTRCSITDVVQSDNPLLVPPSEDVISTFVGDWYLQSYTHGWGGESIFEENEQVFRFNTDGTVEASFVTDDYAFNNFGVFLCSPDEKAISINKVEYYYSLRGDALILDGGSAYDGPTYTLMKIK